MDGSTFISLEEMQGFVKQRMALWFFRWSLGFLLITCIVYFKPELYWFWYVAFGLCALSLLVIVFMYQRLKRDYYSQSDEVIYPWDISAYTNEKRTLETLDGDNWGVPEGKSFLVNECYRLRKVPLKEFSIEQFRIMLGQNIGTEYLLPIVLKILKDNPWVAGDYYPGDLLVCVLKLSENFYLSHPQELHDMKIIVQTLKHVPDNIAGEVALFKARYRC